MKNLNFRPLQANEIDCRIATVKEKGISLLLYKDARVDQNILDEVVGPMNWQRRHTRDNANCIVSLWDTDKKQWIEKEDTGTESYTEKEKGLASDSFKRACFNWGIGRELYTAPFIWVNSPNCTIEKIGNKFICHDDFYVSKIGYNEERNINSLVICREKDNKEVFHLANKAKKKDHSENDQREPPKLSESQIEAIYKELIRTGVGKKSLFNNYRVESLDQMSFEQYQDAMKALQAKPDRPATPIPPENVDEGLSQNKRGDVNGI